MRCLGWLVLAFAALLPEAAAAACTTSMCRSLEQIFQARANDFVNFKGKPSNREDGNEGWEGKHNPPGMTCRLVDRKSSGTGYVYRCNTPMVPGKYLSKEALARAHKSLKAAFAEAKPELKQWDEYSPLGPLTVIGMSETQYVAWINAPEAAGQGYLTFAVRARTLNRSQLVR